MSDYLPAGCTDQDIEDHFGEDPMQLLMEEWATEADHTYTDLQARDIHRIFTDDDLGILHGFTDLDPDTFLAVVQAIIFIMDNHSIPEGIENDFDMSEVVCNYYSDYYRLELNEGKLKRQAKEATAHMRRVAREQRSEQIKQKYNKPKVR